MKNKMKILIAYDGSGFAEEAIEDLRHAGFPTDVEATVLSVTDAWELPETLDRASSRTGRFIHPTAETIQRHLAEVTGRAETLAAAAAPPDPRIIPRLDCECRSPSGKTGLGNYRKIR